MATLQILAYNQNNNISRLRFFDIYQSPTVQATIVVNVAARFFDFTRFDGLSN
jgi:hypothetical protein